MDAPANGLGLRVFERRVLRVEARMVFAGGQEARVRTLNISRGGLAIVANANPMVGIGFDITLDLPNRGETRPTVSAQVRVVHSILAQDEGGFKVGLQFTSIDEASQQAISSYLLQGSALGTAGV